MFCDNGLVAVTVDQIRSVPKVLLHDHLDGGLRPETIVELAAETGYTGLPTTDVAELARWMAGAAQRGRLELYLEAFQHTVGVMQTRDALIRVAAECAEDLAAGGVGFAVAGAAAGGPRSRHLDAFQYVARENFHITIHAGEGFGLPSIWEALQWCGAERLGHGVRIIDDIRSSPGGPPSLGRLASYVRARRIPLEMCPTSNVQTGAAASIKDHPIGLLRELLFRVTVNTDNRLMSGVSLSSEFHALTEAFGYGWGDIEWLTTNAMKSAFAPFDDRLKIINFKIKPGLAVARTAPPAICYN